LLEEILSLILYASNSTYLLLSTSFAPTISITEKVIL